MKCPAASAAAFTLFEAALSLAIVALGVVSTALIFPVGLKAQAHARFKLYAAAKASEMIDAFACNNNVNSNIDAEAFAPWDVPVAYRSLAPDLETRLSSHAFGIMPLPLSIARRLESDGDEIQSILAQGGSLYYSQPMATSNVTNKKLGIYVPNEAQQLVFAVAGYAQNNALQIFPWKAWPYHVATPSPPMHGRHSPLYLPAGSQQFDWQGPHSYCSESAIDPSDQFMPEVFDWTEPDGTTYGFKPYAYDAAPDLGGAVRYLQSALWYCKQIGLPSGFYDPPSPSVSTALKDFAAGLPVPEHKQVQAMRFLAHAALAMTRWKTAAELGGSPSVGQGVPIPSVIIDGTPSPAIDLKHDTVAFYHESCSNLAMRFSASSPYDWGAPRPLERSIMMDCALIEWDLFSDPLAGTLDGTGGIAARQWRPIAASPIKHIGRSFQFPDRDIGPIWGDQSHFTITRPFGADERCRQLVFWSVDWQAYVDAEIAPSSPVDASKYPFSQPIPGYVDFDDRMQMTTMCDPLLFSFRNPEKSIVFQSDVSALPSGTDVTPFVENFSTDVDPVWDRGPANAALFSGLYGADRNGNKLLDRGPVPTSVRMRAQLVARFNFYDPRVPTMLR